MRASVRVVPWMLLILAGCSSGGSSLSKKMDAGDAQSSDADGGKTDGGRQAGAGGTGGGGSAGNRGSVGSGGAGGRGSAGMGGGTGGTAGAGGTGGGGSAGNGGSGGSMSNDPCATDNGGCDPRVTCSSSGSSVSCGACPSGYADTNGNGTRCTDIDECATNNGDCGSATYYSCTNNLGAAPTCADIDECATNNGGCSNSPMATCTNVAGAAASCACPSGYTGSGVGANGCTDIDECATNNGDCGNVTYYSCTNNPGAAPTCADIDECLTNNGGCGSATYWQCSNNLGAAPTCACNPGYKPVDGSNDGQVNPSCVCDLNGTFAIQLTTTESWSSIAYVENASNVVSKSWSIRLQSYDASGKLAVSTQPCGGTSPDLCGTGNPLFGAEAYAAFASNSIWGSVSMPLWTWPDPPGFTLANALPGQPYVEPQTAALLGISLTDPFGAWPASRANVLGGGGTQTNGAAWVDADNDGASGVTDYVVPPGGVLSASSPFPPENYNATSTGCPRSSASARLGYAYLPALDGGTTVRRVKRFSNAGRVISQLSGTISTCDIITGNVIGPQGGQQQVDGRIADCVRVNGTGEAACSATVIDALDAPSGGTHTFNSVSFIIKRVANAITCDQVRAMSF